MVRRNKSRPARRRAPNPQSARQPPGYWRPEKRPPAECLGTCHRSPCQTDDKSPNIPLADVFLAANSLVAAGLIEGWALGGALAAIYYVEPFTTYDADIFFIQTDNDLAAGIPAIYKHLQSKGWQVEGEH